MIPCTACTCPDCVRTEIAAWILGTHGAVFPLLFGRRAQGGILAQRWGIS